MHIEHDGEGNHEHSHSHEHTHSHSHEHEHSHSHEHSHVHDHSHEHAHPEEGAAANAKDIALLKYMLEHNKQHARELADAGGRMKNSSAAAELIREAVHYFEHGNDKLQKAVGLLTGEE